MNNFEKIDKLRDELALGPELKEYVEAELGLSSEIANGYVAADLRKAEMRLITAMTALSEKNKPNLSPTGELIGTELEMKFRQVFRKVMRFHGQPLDGVIEADLVRDLLTVMK